MLEHGLGRTICRNFYFPYARKIWGLPPVELDAEQARRRVSAGSLGKMLRKVLNARARIQEARERAGFFIRATASASISEAYDEAATAAGARLLLETQVTGFETRRRRRVRRC